MFDDLLLDVHQALTTNEHGNALAKAAAANWEIALIDEFQDTDPLQYEIFRQIFIEQGCPLFLVGDPNRQFTAFAVRTFTPICKPRKMRTDITPLPSTTAAMPS